MADEGQAPVTPARPGRRHDWIATRDIRAGYPVIVPMPAKDWKGRDVVVKIEALAENDGIPGDECYVVFKPDGERLRCFPPRQKPLPKVPCTPSRRRAMRIERNGGREPVNRERVFAAHGWTCWLCSLPIPRDVPPKHRLYGSLDHVVAVANGGQHREDNLRPAHRGCNSAKGTKVVEVPS